MSRLIESPEFSRRKCLGIGIMVTLCLFWINNLGAQDLEESYSIAAKAQPLSEVLLDIVDKTGISLAYDAKLVEGKWVNCTIAESSLKNLLSCVLRRSDLDFYQLSSGTFVINVKPELKPGSGSITGLITEFDSGQPVSGAHIKLYGTGLGTVTNEAGRFLISNLLPGEYSLGVSHVSYEFGTSNILVQSGRLTVLKKEIEKDILAFEPIVIDGLSSRAPSLDLGQINLAIRDSQIKGDLVRSAIAQGSSPISMNPATADVHIESGAAGDHVFRLDGIPVFLPSALSPFIGSFAGTALRSIEIQRSGFGASSGSQIAGRIDIQQKSHQARSAVLQIDPFNLQAGASHFQKMGSSQLSIMAAGRINSSRVIGQDPSKGVIEQFGMADPFLVVSSFSSSLGSKSQRFTEIDEIASLPLRTHNYSDFHLGAKMSFSGLKTLKFTAYRGNANFDSQLSDERNIQNEDEAVISEGRPATLSIRNKYHWHSGAFGLKYESVIGISGLFSIGLRHSYNKLGRAYDLADEISLNLLQPQKQLVTVSTEAVRDDFFLKESALDAKYDLSFQNHILRSGLSLIADRQKMNFHFNQFEDAPNAGPYTLAGLDFDSEVGETRESRNLYRAESFIEDRIQFGDNLEAEVGMRLSFIPSQTSFFAEPRLSLRLDKHLDGLGTFSSRSATGLYRQFVNQFDVSVFDAGSSLPSFRVWMPIDENTRPPLSVHFSQDLKLQFSEEQSFSLTAYLKHQPHTLIVDYRQTFETERINLASAKSRLAGLGLTWSRKSELVQLSASYFYNYSKRESDAVFDGKAHPLPWSEPHSLRVWSSVSPMKGLSLGVQSHAVWKRSWAYRRAYYDYLSWQIDNELDDQLPDFNNPGDDELPSLINFDAFLGYMRPLGSAKLQFRFEVFNLLNRKNVSFNRIQTSEGNLSDLPITLHSITPAAALRVTF